MKAVVDAVAGAKYTQTFHQDSSWDSHLRKTVKGDWAATGTVTFPIEAGKWGAADGGGSAAVSARSNNLRSTAATRATAAADCRLTARARRRARATTTITTATHPRGRTGTGTEEEGKGNDNDNNSYASEGQDGQGQRQRQQQL